MSATILNIQARHRLNPLAWVSIRDFTVEGSGALDSESVFQDPHASLYCIDHPKRQFIFVHTPKQIDLSQSPFLFQAQFEHAQHLIAVPYEDLYQLTCSASLEPDRLIFLYSVGRCGSTLLSRALNQLDQIVSLSEPDVFTDLQKLRAPNGKQDKEIRTLLRCCLVALTRPFLHEHHTLWAIKFRSFNIELADLIYDAFPSRRNLFIYRDAENWAHSTTRAFKKLESEQASVGTAKERKWKRRSRRISQALETLKDSRARHLLRRARAYLESRAGVLSDESIEVRIRMIPALRPYAHRLQFGELSRMEYISLEWVSAMLRYIWLRQAGIPFSALRYEDLITDPENVLRGLCRLWGLPEAQATQALSAFASDSQQGTSLARSVLRSEASPRLTERHLAELRAVLKGFSEVNRPDITLPGTLFTEQGPM